MQASIEWHLRPELSSLYAAWLLARGDKIHNENVARALRRLEPLSSKHSSELLLQSIRDPENLKADSIANDIHAAVIAAFPRMESELTTRQRPLKMQWEARGPGMLSTISKSLVAAGHDAEAVPIGIWLVQPWNGGGALLMPCADKDGLDTGVKSLLFEAVITDVIPELPEIVRLAWAISRLRYDLSDDELISQVIAAAASVGLVQDDDQTRELAQQEWI